LEIIYEIKSIVNMPLMRLFNDNFNRADGYVIVRKFRKYV